MNKLLMTILLVLVASTNGWGSSYYLDDYGVSATIGSTGAIATAFNQAMQTTASSGTGAIGPFLALHARGSEEGFNTDGDLNYDQIAGIFTHSLKYSDLGQYSGYFEFALDLKQIKNIYLTEFEMWSVSSSYGGSLETYEELQNYGTRMFSLGDNEIQIRYDLWAGSGNNLDMLLQIPVFASDASNYIYVWSKFSNTDSGFEEWSVRSGTTPPPAVPEPGTLLLLGGGLLGLAAYGRRRKKD